MHAVDGKAYFVMALSGVMTLSITTLTITTFSIKARLSQSA
jgi:hypothetical protein